MDPATILSAPLADRLTLQQLSKEQGTSPVTCWRWSLRGINGLRLPSVKMGNKRLTTRSMFVEWCRQLTALADGEPLPTALTDTHRENVIDRAECEAARLLGLAPPAKEEQ